MKVHPVHASAVTLAALLLLQSAVAGQWLKQPAAGLPRTPDGKADLAAPAPRSGDGKPDLSGLWQPGTKYDSDFRTSDAQPWAQARVRERAANPAPDSWATLCLRPAR
jgi:hypothetical protein